MASESPAYVLVGIHDGVTYESLPLPRPGRSGHFRWRRCVDGRIGWGADVVDQGRTTRPAGSPLSYAQERAAGGGYAATVEEARQAAATAVARCDERWR